MVTMCESHLSCTDTEAFGSVRWKNMVDESSDQ